MRETRPAWATTVRWSATLVGIALAAFLGLLFLAAIGRVLVWVMIALFLALALDRGVGLLERVLPRRFAVLTVFVAAIAAIAGIGVLVVPPLVDQVRQFADELPAMIDKLSRGRGPLGVLEERFHIVERVRDAVASGGPGTAVGLTGPVFAAVSRMAQTVIGVLAITFLTLFMLLRGPSWWQAFLGFLPQRQRPLWGRIGEHVREAIGGWVAGAVIIALTAGTSATVVLLIIGAPYALTIGLIVALLDPIPFVGVTLAGLVGGLVTLAADGLSGALIFLAFLVVYQQVVENHLLVPLIYGRTVQLDALGVLLAVLIGGQLAGIIGAIAAVPIAGALKAVAGELLRWRRHEMGRDTLLMQRDGRTTDLHGGRPNAGRETRSRERT